MVNKNPKIWTKTMLKHVVVKRKQKLNNEKLFFLKKSLIVIESPLKEENKNRQR